MHWHTTSPSEASRTDSVQGLGGPRAGLASCVLLAQPDLVPRTDAPRDSLSLAVGQGFLMDGALCGGLKELSDL